MPFKFNPFTSNFDQVNSENFNYYFIPVGFYVFIPLYQEMRTRRKLRVKGTLKIEGRTVVD